MKIVSFLFIVSAVLAPLAPSAWSQDRSPGPTLSLRPGDHVALVGNALADRMQHSGHFETLLQAKYPEHRLVVRNLAASGDEVVIRHRSENFGTPDEWLTRVRADVILAFFGFNESFRGPEGVDRFKADLDRWIKETQGKNYSGRGAPRIALVSPIAAERHQDPNYEDPVPLNANLAIYTDAMAAVARDNGVPFVNVFQASRDLYAEAARGNGSLTINGFHLSGEGDRLLAPVLFRGLLGIEPPSGDHAKLRAAINEKSSQWHARYRTIDGYNVYGGRSALAYQPGKGPFISDRNAAAPYISNYKVMQEEMSQRDVLTANRDLRVWAVAAGGDLVIDDSNLPPVTQVPSNKPGSQDDGSHVFLSGEQAIEKMTVHSGMKVNLFADEKQFPELVSPVQMAWDTRGRLWVAAWLNYPERTPTSKEGDKLLVFEDLDADGKADKVTTFLDDLNCPTGFQFYKDGVLVVQAPDLWFVRDTDGDGRADWKERVLMGLDSADSHHTANAICHDPGGAIYLSDGVFHRTQIETAFGPVRNNDAAIFRLEPRTSRFETYIPYGFANPHGRVFDRWGNDLVTDATGNATYFGPAFSGRLDYPAKHPGMKQFWDRPSRPCAGTGILSSRHFPEEFQGNFLNLNVIGFQGIFRVKVSEDGSGLKGETLEHLVHSSDPNFRPAAISVGPDGALYFLDWHKPLIGHMQHHLRDPNRDKEHGRVYRITYAGRPLLKPQKIHGQPIPDLLKLLEEPEDSVRELAKIELGSREPRDVLAALPAWIASLDASKAEYEHHITEALWLHQWLNVVNANLLDRLLASPQAEARAAAARVLCYWRDRIPDALPRFLELARDENPMVRLEAVRASSFYRVPEAAEVAVAILSRPTDYYLDYCLRETLRQLEPVWRSALSEGRLLAADNPAGQAFLVKSLRTSELQKLPRTAPILEELLRRPGFTDSDRSVALLELARARDASRTTLLLNLLADASSEDPTLAGLHRLLPLQLPDDLAKERERITRLTSPEAPKALRPAAWATLAAIDDSFDKVWPAASASPDTLADLITGIPLLNDPQFRARAFGRVRPLVASPESALGTAGTSRQATGGRFVRVELPRRGTLTLAEVEVFSDGANIARRGTATQSSTSNGGDPGRAIDGRHDGSFGSGTQTHTRENDRRPWWEVDLGAEYPIESIVLWNRTDDTLGRRLDGYSLVVLNNGRSEVFRSDANPAPAESARHAIQTDPAGALRRAAIRALVSMGTEPEATFRELTALIQKRADVAAAAQGLRALPRSAWPKSQAAAATASLLAWAKTVPAGERTREDYLQALQTAGDLAGLLPEDQAAAARADLRELRVSVFVIRTVREQMRFDTPRLVVEAGKPFEIIVENDDFMPHNLVVVKPGTREKLGAVTEKMSPEKLDNQGRAFVTDSTDILAATRLLEQGMKETLKLTAPSEEGDYTFVCTFPGHWQVMFGQLIVTRDVDAYLQKHPVAPIPATTAEHGHLE
ncbi:MAG: PVC-type heme-binding CxxCH protein [Limisphaerales bacterium]